MTDMDGLDELDLQVAALDENLGGATQMAAAFNGELPGCARHSLIPART